MTASDAAAGDFFSGYSSVSVDGDVAVIGAFGRDDACPTNPDCLSGAAYVYRFNGLRWVEEAKLTPSDPTEDSLFGYSVALSGDVVVIGAHRDDWLCPGELRCDSGSAYIFRFDGDNWIEEAKLVAHDGARNDEFGFSVAIDTDTAVVTAVYDDDAGQYSGSAYVFQFDGVDSWVEKAKLTASDGAAGDQFGYFASISGNTVVIGAYWDDDACPGDPQCNSGSAYVFEEPVSGWVTTTETAKLTASDAAGGGGYFGDAFGNRVAIDGDIILIAAPGNDGAAPDGGAAYAFHKPVDGWVTMTETVKLTAWDATAADAFGSIVLICGEAAVIGAAGYSEEGAGSGSAYVYRFNGSTWNGQAKVTASDAAPGDGFGAAGSISADTVMIGAAWDDDACPDDPDCDSGSVYVFDIADCNANGVCDSHDLASGASSDCDSDLIPDECKIADCLADDPSCQDCNDNDIPDECDITSGGSFDLDGNGIPDECGACCGPVRCDQITQATCEPDGEYLGDGTTCQAECSQVLCNEGNGNVGCWAGCLPEVCDDPEEGCTAPLTSETFEFVKEDNFLSKHFLPLVQAGSKFNRFQEGVQDVLLQLYNGGQIEKQPVKIGTVQDAIAAIEADYKAQGSTPINVVIFGHAKPGLIKVGEDALGHKIPEWQANQEKFANALAGKIKTLYSHVA